MHQVIRQMAAKDSDGAGKGGAGATAVVYLQLAFLAAAALVRETYADLGLSSFLTLSAALQLLSLCLLRLKVAEQKGVQGISQRSLIMQSVVHGLRLCSTIWLRGYIPVDATGDGMYQLLDLAAFLLSLDLVHCCRKEGRYAHTYQAEHDTVDVRVVMLICCLLAVLVHPDLNDRPLFDSAWTASLYVDSVAMFPQIWLMSRASGGGCAAEGISSQYMIGVACSRAANFVFWYHGYVELAPEGEGRVNWPGYAVVAAHVIQFLLLADFLWHHFVKCGKQLGGALLPLGGSCCRPHSAGRGVYL